MGFCLLYVKMRNLYIAGFMFCLWYDRNVDSKKSDWLDDYFLLAECKIIILVLTHSFCICTVIVNQYIFYVNEYPLQLTFYLYAKTCNNKG